MKSPEIPFSRYKSASVVSSLTRGDLVARLFCTALVIVFVVIVVIIVDQNGIRDVLARVPLGPFFVCHIFEGLLFQ